MMCCNHDCTQGPTCPVRATRDAGACSQEPQDTTQADTDMAIYLVLVLAAYTLVCGFLGYLWAIHGSAIDAFLWALLARMS